MENLELLNLAKKGDTEALGALLEAYRDQFTNYVNQKCGQPLQVRVAPSDILQKSYLEAHRDLPGFRGATEAEFLGWLKRILENNIAQAARDNFDAEKRSLKKEEIKLDETQKGGKKHRDHVRAKQSTPSLKAMKAETRKELEEAIKSLPEDQAEAVRLRHLEGWTLKELATHFGRSEVAVAGLLKRGMKTLRAIIEKDA